ncbi:MULTISPECIES: hypothetical protein [unclassified Paenibacillus]|uniref:hypothetical protein n=1 Tax=unclassified Paenibacillus TaxID=185978 RepID=UPI002785A43C|nr:MULTISPECIES: hypothetical protein [unclassified Paenibacillus]MDQ0896373.1 hypothetical protein [Paenibacillus sp. V4I7]MDQ0914083.1 hypothetical protein [Paenibacillus sp. V4I5]
MVLIRQTESKADSGKQDDVRRGRPPSVNALQSAHRSIGNRMVQRMIQQHLTNTSHETIQRQLNEDQMDELEYTVNNYAMALGCSKNIVDRTLSILQKRHNSVAGAIQDIDNAFSQAFSEIKGVSKEEDKDEDIGMDIEESSNKQATEVALQAPHTQTKVNTPSLESSNHEQQFPRQNDSYPQNTYPSTDVSQQPHSGNPNNGNYGQSQFGFDPYASQQPQTGYPYSAYYGQTQSGYDPFASQLQQTGYLYSGYYGQTQSGYDSYNQQHSGHGSHYVHEQPVYGMYPQSTYPQSNPTNVTNQTGYAFQQIEPIVNNLFPDRASNIMELLQWASTSPMIAGFKTWYSDMIQRANDESMVKDMLYELLDVQREINTNQEMDRVYHLDNDKQSSGKSFDYKATREKKYPGLVMSMQETVAKHEVTHVEQPVRSSEDLHAGVRHIAEKVLREDKDQHKNYKIGGTIAMTKGVAPRTTVEDVLKELLQSLNSNPRSIEARVINLDRIVIVDHNFKVLGTFTKNKSKWTLE